MSDAVPRKRGVPARPALVGAAAVVLVALVAWGWLRAELRRPYAAWDGLLKKHVRWLADGKQSRVDYAGFQADRAALGGVLKSLSAVTPAQFDGFTREQQIAFLVNAYNAFTVELILTKYPDLKSIKDLGSIFRIFKRLHARDKYGGGTGSGLTFAKQIVERHGGEIWVESTYGEGTAFFFTLQSSHESTR